MAYILGIFLHLNRKRDPPVIPTRGRKTDPRSTLLSFLEMVAFSVRFNPFLSRLDGTLPPLTGTLSIREFPRLERKQGLFSLI